jgi:hypothetical protein
VCFVRSGADIAQCHMADGYSPRERMRNLGRGLPPFVHSQGAKPWRSPAERPCFLDVSPYLFAARAYAAELGQDGGWLNSSSTVGRVLSIMTGHSANLAGLPLALITQVQRVARIRSRLRRFCASG